LAVKVYSPTGIAGNVKIPDSLVVVLELTPVSAFLRTTVTLGTGAPVESSTVPATEPAVNCPKAGIAQKSSPARIVLISIRRFLIVFVPLVGH
jgi:hypothetical protein